MKMATYFGAVKSILFWLVAPTIALSEVVQTIPNETFMSQGMLPYGFAMISVTESMMC